jgi:membrane protein DedA with SNARE-associated domain/membrane-associated phospholipid phosphatase
LKQEASNSERLRLVVIVGLVVAGFIAFQRLVPNLDVEGFLEDVGSDLGDWTYALVGVLAFLETGAFVGLVFPGETAVILGGAIAGQGETSVVITIAVVWFCAWAGDSVSFLIGMRLGRGFVMRHGPKVRITRERFGQVEDYFQRHGGKTILVGRFIGLVRALAPFVAGSSRMRYRAFLPFSVLGTGLWSAAFVLVGYFLSQSLNQAADVAGRGTFVFGVTVAVIVGVVLAVRFVREPSNRARIVARLEATPLIRRLVPELRFLWHRLTPGGLGLEFTSVVAILSVAAFVLVGYTSIVSGDPGPTAGDREAFDVVNDLEAAWVTDVAKVVTVLGSTAVTLTVALAAGAVLAANRRWPELVVLLASVAIAHVAVPELKDAVARPRPAGGLVDASGFAFPSGHATYSIIYPWLALTLTVRLRPRMAHASALIAAGIVVAAAVGLSRVYLRVHYLSDVSAGWALGTCAFAACAALAMLILHLRQNGSPDAAGEDR